MADYLTEPELADIVPTWGDLLAAQRSLGPDADLATHGAEVAAKVIHRAAMRAGIAGNDELEFMDRVPLKLINELVALVSMENPTKGATPS